MQLIKKIIGGIFVIFLLSSLVRNIFNYTSKNQFFQDYKNDYEKENKKNIELKTEIVKKQSVSEIEKTIRNKLNLLKENEVAVILPVPTLTIITPTPTSAPIWKQWVNLYTK
jgi:sortase (surface protein transpeptidase)